MGDHHQCPTCQAILASEESYHSHRLQYHPSKEEMEERVQCRYCVRTFWSRKGVNKHELICLGQTPGMRVDAAPASPPKSPEKPSFKCSICKMEFLSKYNLKCHDLVKHAKQRAFANQNRCRFCNKLFVDKTRKVCHQKNCPACKYETDTVMCVKICYLIKDEHNKI